MQALLGRGYEVTIYHRGLHEPAGLPDVEHIHGDPHFADTIERDLAGRRWDLAVAMYGRIRLLAQALIGKTERLITISGSPAARPSPWLPIHESDGYPDPGNRMVDRIVETERAVLRGDSAGHYAATVIRYPYVYGPLSLMPEEWSVIKRVMDGRRRWVLPGGGMAIVNRCATQNAVHMIGLAVDRPEVAAGQVYQASDDRIYPYREWIELISGIMGFEFEYVDIPWGVLLGPHSSPNSDLRGGLPLRAAPQGGGHRAHRLLSHAKAKSELGYQDIVSPHEWIARTVEYWIANPPPIGGENFLRPEMFDYPAEDRLLSWWDEVRTTVPTEVQAVYDRLHPYPHPAKAASETATSATD